MIEGLAVLPASERRLALERRALRPRRDARPLVERAVALRAAGVTVRAIARELGVDVGTASRWSRGIRVKTRAFEPPTPRAPNNGRRGRYHPGDVVGRRADGSGGLTLVARLPGGHRWSARCACGYVATVAAYGAPAACRACDGERRRTFRPGDRIGGSEVVRFVRRADGACRYVLRCLSCGKERETNAHAATRNVAAGFHGLCRRCSNRARVLPRACSSCETTDPRRFRSKATECSRCERAGAPGRNGRFLCGCAIRYRRGGGKIVILCRHQGGDEP